MKTKTTHRHFHPIHWHASMFVAIAAILLTSFKCSGEMIRALHALPAHVEVMDSVYMRGLREAETGHTSIMFSGYRPTSLSGK